MTEVVPGLRIAYETSDGMLACLYVTKLEYKRGTSASHSSGVIISCIGRTAPIKFWVRCSPSQYAILKNPDKMFREPAAQYTLEIDKRYKRARLVDNATWQQLYNATTRRVPVLY